MPKIIDYPRASMRNALELARDVDSLGGAASMEITAAKSGRAVSGAFKAITSSAVKYGFITVTKGRLSVTDLFKEHKLAYSPADEQKALRAAFFRVPVFNRIWTQFKGKSIPLEIFEKVLMREYAVSESDASRVVGYFMEAAKAAGVFVDDKLVENIEDVPAPVEDDHTADESVLTPNEKKTVTTAEASKVEQVSISRPIIEVSSNGGYVVRISGPGMDSQIALNEEEDLMIVQAMLRKVGRLLVSTSEKQKPSTETADG